MASTAPLRHRAFRYLGVGFAFSTMGIWMASLASQWYLVELPGGAHLAPLVQTAITLPVAVLAIPSGVIADTFDRRRLLMAVQAATVAVAALMATLAWAGSLSPGLLLLLTAAIGVSNALTLTPFQSLVPELVPRAAIPAAAGMVAVGVNLARIVGPAVAGIVLAGSGAGAVFALTAAASGVFLIALARWRSEPELPQLREPVVAAVRSGLRFVTHSPQALWIMVRGLWFTTGVTSVFALLPLLAKERLGLGAASFGSLLACIGVGAVAGGFSAAGLRTRLGANSTIAVCFATCAAMTVLLSTVRSVPVVMAVLAVAGWGWTACLSTTGASMQLYLPGWVRARGLGAYWVAVFGGQALGAVVFGAIAAVLGVGPAFLGAAALLLLGAGLGLAVPLKRLDEVDRSPSATWHEPELDIDVESLSGEVVVQTVYWVSEADVPLFLERMISLRRIRLRTGGTRWRLLQDVGESRRYVEEYAVRSWQEYQRQAQERSVVSEHEVERAVADMSDPTPQVRRHLRARPRAIKSR